MSRNNFLNRLAWLLVAGLAIAVLLRLMLGRQEFSIYGLAMVALVTLPMMTSLLSQRLARAGLPPRRALLYAVPVGLLALGHIAYWLLFFSGSVDVAVMLGSVRAMSQARLPALLPALYLVVAGLAAWPIYLAAQE